ncbi:acetyl-CoA carboxylase biotin carboxylase subunit family protein [Gryllotalpicola reticulitermitis]|uniref:Acetyl-CoA carboxylase biotin carboxylase subunit family protein n=1 Tax=Gryllotalpicola reticulitermitis TaxID=1184153 RepID=A0ABV8Q834_9MICO
MRAAVIGASSESLHGIKVAQQLGYDVVALDGNPEAAGLRAADSGLVVDITDPVAVFAALGDAPDIVIPVPIGRYLTTTGVVNDRFGLPGVSETSARLCTDKYEFHRVMELHSLRSTTAILIPAGSVDHPLPAQFPVVLKPRFGSGSRGVTVCMTSDELENALLTVLPSRDDLIIEEFAEGTEYGVDAAVVDGALRVILLREKLNTPLPYRQAIGYYSMPAEHPMQAAAAAALAIAVDALKITSGLLHADLIERDGRAFIVELSARPSGHHLHDLFTPLASGVDPIREFLLAARDGADAAHFAPSASDALLMRFFDFDHGTVAAAPDMTALAQTVDLVEFEERIVGREMIPVTNGPELMQRGFFIVRGTDRADLGRQADAVLTAFTFEGA